MGGAASSLTTTQSRKAVHEHSAQVVAAAHVAATRDRFKIDTLTDDVLRPGTFNVHITIVGADGRSGKEHLLQVASTATAFGQAGQLDTFFVDEECGAVILPPRALHIRVSRSVTHEIDQIVHTKMRWTLGFASLTFFGDAAWWEDSTASWDVSYRGEAAAHPPGQWDLELLGSGITMAPPSVSGLAHVHTHGPARATLPFPSEGDYVETRTIATAAMRGGVGSDVDTLYTLRELMPRMRTGDVVLYNSVSLTGPVTRAVTGLPFSHAGIIVIEDVSEHRSRDGCASESAPVRNEHARVEREANAAHGERARARERRRVGSHVLLAYESTPNHGECSFLYRYIPRESCSQFDSLPLTSLTEGGTRDFALEHAHSQVAAGFAGVFAFDFVERVLAYEGDVLWSPLAVDLDDARAANLAAFVRGHHLGMTRYDFAQFFGAAVHRLSGGVVDINGADDDAEMFCSEFVAEALKVGLDVSTHDASLYSSFRLPPWGSPVDPSALLHEHGRQIFAEALVSVRAIPRCQVAALERTHTARMAPGDLYKLALLEKVSLLKATTDTMRLWARKSTNTMERRRLAARDAVHVIGRGKASRWGSYASESTSMRSVEPTLLSGVLSTTEESEDGIDSDSSSGEWTTVEDRRTSSLSAVD
jgi:hypothetical protein